MAAHATPPVAPRATGKNWLPATLMKWVGSLSVLFVVGAIVFGVMVPFIGRLFHPQPTQQNQATAGDSHQRSQQSASSSAPARVETSPVALPAPLTIQVPVCGDTANRTFSTPTPIPSRVFVCSSRNSGWNYQAHDRSSSDISDAQWVDGPGVHGNGVRFCSTTGQAYTMDLTWSNTEGVC